jgi:hypothetical protein
LLAIGQRSGLSVGFNPDQLRAAAVAISTLIGTYARR